MATFQAGSQRLFKLVEIDLAIWSICAIDDDEVTGKALITDWISVILLCDMLPVPCQASESAGTVRASSTSMKPSFWLVLECILSNYYRAQKAEEFEHRSQSSSALGEPLLLLLAVTSLRILALAKLQDR